MEAPAYRCIECILDLSWSQAPRRVLAERENLSGTTYFTQIARLSLVQRFRNRIDRVFSLPLY